jgi:hypothetical protein
VKPSSMCTTWVFSGASRSPRATRKVVLAGQRLFD